MGARIIFGLDVLASATPAFAQASAQVPEGSQLTLFALGRTIGWIGHAIEQYEKNEIIRPRAKYVGVAPAAGTIS